MKQNAIHLFCVIAMLVGITLTAARCHKRQVNMQQWEENREIIIVEVKYGQGIDDFGYVYKPDWMDIREYREYVKELNGMKNCTLYAGQELKLYA